MILNSKGCVCPSISAFLINLAVEMQQEINFLQQAVMLILEVLLSFWFESSWFHWSSSGLWNRWCWTKLSSNQTLTWVKAFVKDTNLPCIKYLSSWHICTKEAYQILFCYNGYMLLVTQCLWEYIWDKRNNFGPSSLSKFSVLLSLGVHSTSQKSLFVSLLLIIDKIQFGTYSLMWMFIPSGRLPSSAVNMRPLSGFAAMCV